MRIKVILFFLIINVTNTFAQTTADKDAYVKTITERAAKITAVLGIDDEAKALKVTNIIRDQYSNLSDIHNSRDLKIKAIKEKNATNKAERDTLIAKETRTADASLRKLHKKYISRLASHLSADQIEKVKNGMTYNVVPITYKAYQEQILTLTEDQKKQILTWLIEAREFAMDAETSDKKHAWFGKYKGRINNYLSAAGYDLKKEGVEWEKRRKAATAAKN